MSSRRLAAFLAGATVVLGIVASVLGACGDDAPEPPPSESSDEVPEIREMVLASPPVEGSQPPLFAAKPEVAVTDVLARLAAARRDDDCKGVLLRVGPMAGAWGRAPEIAAAVARVREAGKPVHCHFDATDNLGYALMAASCDRISMTPAGDLGLVGVAAHVFYARSLLSKIGLRADFMQVGRYKGAADPFTMDAMPETTRETLGGLLDDLSAHLVESISEGRELPPERVRALIDQGPFDALDAREAGLVDDVGFDDEAAEHARQAGDARRVRRVDLRSEQEPLGLADVLSALAGEPPEAPAEGPRVALVQLEGEIVDEEDAGMRGARSGPFVRAMRSFAGDDDVKAIVLRIDSPGGSALASDRMWHAVRRVAARKPVIVSVGDMAASGGYYVASAGTTIFAHDTSILGSIGVVAGKITIEELAADIGVNVEVLTRGQNAAWTTPARPFTDEERRILRRSMHRTYSRFIRRVMTGRGMEREAVQSVAEGRIMSGRDAREAGLVDHQGGLRAALDFAREQTGVSENTPVERWPRRRGLLDALAESMGGQSPDDRSRAVVRELAAAAGPIGEAASLLPMLLRRERTAVVVPWVLRIE